MTDFLLLYSGGAMPETEAERAEVTKAWEDWMHSLGEGLKDAGNPFGPAAKTISADGAVREGALAPATGYSIVSADSLDAAVAAAKGSPALEGGSEISVFEIFPVM